MHGRKDLQAKKTNDDEMLPCGMWWIEEGNAISGMGCFGSELQGVHVPEVDAVLHARIAD